jgi:hypothetical protein
MNAQLESGTDLRLFTDPEGNIWFDVIAIANRKSLTGKANNSDLSVEDFVAQSWLQQADRVRLFGTADNAALICALHHQKKCDPKSAPGSIQVGSPIVCSHDRLKDPDYAIRQMETLYGRTGSCGGWHEVTTADYISYALAREIKKTGGEFSDVVAKLLPEHPAWPALLFIPTLSAADAAKMLGTIIDPRWYIDTASPDRLSKMRCYMGLFEKNMRCLAAGLETNRGIAFDRARSVYRAWCCGVNTDKATNGSPGSFLMRKLVNEKTKSRGMLKASTLFLSFVRDVWLDALTTDRTLFVPKHFFRDNAEAAAYTKHARQVSNDRKKH